MEETLKARLLELKKEKDAVILAHYYVTDEVQEVADYIGDSFYLSKKATELKNKTIVFCGVSFMGESAKILNPEKTVIMPDLTADCAMAHMADIDKIKMVRDEYNDVAVVCYINSSADLKQYCDVCVTSANAVKIVENLPNRNIYFIPDENLARFVAGKVKDKHFIFNDGFCPIHKNITKELVTELKSKYPDAKVLAHPECVMDVLELSDFIGSTSQIIDFAQTFDDKEFIVLTEIGVGYELKKRCPDKTMHFLDNICVCHDMKKNSIEKIIKALENMDNDVVVDETVAKKATGALTRMLEIAGKRG